MERRNWLIFKEAYYATRNRLPAVPRRNHVAPPLPHRDDRYAPMRAIFVYIHDYSNFLAFPPRLTVFLRYLFLRFRVEIVVFSKKYLI